MSDSFYDQLFSVRDKVALVTGGTRGIGLMIAEALLRGGARVYISSRKADACQEAESALSEFGDCSAYPCDISSMEGCQELAAEIARREPKLDILVNNAGLTWTASLEDLDEKGWDRVVDLDMKTPFFLLQQLLPQLRAAASPERRASVINITSVAALAPTPLQNYSYVAAKSGLGFLSRQLAKDLMQDHINVNAIAPGLFRSKMTAALFTTEESEAQVLNSVPMKRDGRMEDIGGLTIFLCSSAGAYVTGATIACDGGSTMAS